MLTEETKLRGELAQVWGMYDSSKTALAERDARIAELERELEEVRKDAERLTAERDSAWEALAMIGDFAHDRSTGPAVPDALWEVRAMAYTAAEPAIRAAIKEQT